MLQDHRGERPDAHALPQLESEGSLQGGKMEGENSVSISVRHQSRLARRGFRWLRSGGSRMSPCHTHSQCK